MRVSALVTLILCLILIRLFLLSRTTDFNGNISGAVGIAGIAVVAIFTAAVLQAGAGDETVARIDGRDLTRAQMEDDLKLSLQPVNEEAYGIRSAWIQEKIDREILSSEAAKEHKTVDDLLAANVDALINVDYDEVKNTIQNRHMELSTETYLLLKSEMLAKEEKRLKRKYVDALASGHSIAIYLHKPLSPKIAIDLTTAKISGPPDGKVQLVVFSDFECPFCAQLEPVLNRIRHDFQKQITVAFRYYPLQNHERAVPAAEAAECAAEQGKFWEYHDKLFEDGGDLSDAKLLQIAKDVGLDEQRFISSRDSGRPGALVEKSYKDAVATGLDFAPSLFLNGRMITGALDYEILKKLINDEIQRNQ